MSVTPRHTKRMNFGIQDCQQIATDGSRIVSIHPGPFVVRVHEARDFNAAHTPSRYYLSVDLKFRASDALREEYWFGMTKAEATREANALVAKLTSAVAAVNAAETATMPGKDILVQRQKARLASLVAKYEAEVVPA